MNKFLISLMGIIFTIILTVLPIMADEHDVYRFPVSPGSKEWINMDTTAERIKALQIPADILGVISTEGLVRTCLNYPLLFEIWLSNSSIQSGADSVIESFNGLQELMRRKDAAMKLLDEYNRMDAGLVTKCKTKIKRGSYTLQISQVEILLSQRPLLANLKETELLTLLKRSIHVMDSKKLYPQDYAIASFNTGALLMGRILEKLHDSQFQEIHSERKEFRAFLESGSSENLPLVIDDIARIAKETIFSEK